MSKTEKVRRRKFAELKKFLTNYKNYILLLILSCSALLSVFYFTFSFGRIIESLRDLWKSVCFYFANLAEREHLPTVTVNDYSAYRFRGSLSIFPDAWSGFVERWKLFWRLFVFKDNVKGYFSYLGNKAYKISRFLIFVVPLVVVFWILRGRYYEKWNIRYNRDSKPLSFFKKLWRKIIRPAVKWISGMFSYIRSCPWFYKSLFIIWAYNFNLLTVVVELIAYYLYFVFAFDWASIYRQCYKLIVDLYVIFSVVPAFVWFLLAFALLEKISYKQGKNALEHNERKNRGWINIRSIITFIVGLMGKGKTTSTSDMALSASVQMRDDAFKIMLDVDFEFPRFPWQNFRVWLNGLFASHVCFNCYQTKQAVERLQRLFLFSRSFHCEREFARHFRRHRIDGWRWKNMLFDYDYKTYGLTYFNGVEDIDIWKDLSDYAQAYLIYTRQSALILSNYSIRTDDRFIDYGNLPLWDSDFFRFERKRIQQSHHAHILDFDMLRLGKKMVEDNPSSFAFGYGVYAITEIDKERQNALALQEVKASSVDCNQKNDMFNEMLKMVRHGTVIRNVPFVRFFVDAQRPEDWGANAREVSEVVHIADRINAKLVLPFYAPFRLFCCFYERFYNKIQNQYVSYSHVRGDNTLYMWIKKNLGAMLKHHYERVYNRYGYSLLVLHTESGKLDGALSESQYYLQYQKIYNDRFNTASMAGFFEKVAKHSVLGLDDLPEYATTTASDEELQAQNSLMFKRINSLSSLIESER